MNRRSLGAFAFPLLVLAGCSVVLGIPSDIERAGADSPVDSAGAEANGDSAFADQLARDDGVDPDVKIDAPVVPDCNLAKEFGMPVLLPGISTPGPEGSPRLSPDELTIYFDAQRDGDLYFDLFVAHRLQRTDSFGPAVRVAGGVNTPDNEEYAPNVSLNGLTLFFERQVPNSENDDFYVATRNKIDDPFDLATPVSGVNTPLYEGKLYVRGDGKELYFVKNGGRPSLEIHVAKLGANGYVTTLLANVNSSADELAPVISQDGRVLYFASKRPYTPGRTDENIWVATRANDTDPFGLPAQVLTVNSVSDDEPSWISPDGCRLYLSSGRPGGAGMQDIYVATRPK